MAGDERTQLPKGYEPAVRRRHGDPRDVPVAPAAGPRAVRAVQPRSEDDTTEPPAGVPRRLDRGPAALPGGSGPVGPVESYSAGAPRNRLVADGRFGELFVMFIINILLGIVTLGFYRFWGKTRIRKYVWSHSSFRGERFEYSGTGMELFLGFLFAFLVFGPPFLGFYAWIYFDPPPKLPDDPRAPMDPAAFGHYMLLYLVGLGLAILAFYFIHVANYAAYRYRLSRTVWRGIRGSVGGSAWVYGFLGFGLSALNGISLFWTKPWADSVLLKYRLGRTSFGSVGVKCDLQAGPLYPPFAAAWLITMLATLVAVGGLAALILGTQNLAGGRTSEAEAMSYLILGVLIYLLVPAVWLITINFYRAKLIREVASRSKLDTLSFRFEVEGWSLLWFNVANFLLVLLTLGLLVPLVILRYQRFVARYLAVDGEIDYAAMRQATDRGPRYGEGIAEFFGVGVI